MGTITKLIFGAVVILAVLMLTGNSPFAIAKVGIENSTCTIDADCVPATCCHPTSCINATNAPSCDNVMCTMEVRPGDISGCACVNSVCTGNVTGGGTATITTPIPTPTTAPGIDWLGQIWNGIRDWVCSVLKIC